MKKSIIWNILFGFVLALQLTAEALTAAIILRLNMLPDKFVVVLVLAFLLMGAMTAVLLFVRFGKKPVSTVRRIMACILALLVVCGCALISKLGVDAYRTMHAVTTPVEETDVRNMYVLVRVDDPAQTLADTAGYTYAVVENHDTEYVEAILNQVQEQTGKENTVIRFTTVAQVVDSLLGEDSQAVVLSGANISLLQETESYKNMWEKVRILCTVPMSELEQTEPTTETTTLPEGDVTNTPFVVYISGSDTRSQYLSTSRSDVNILVVVNPVTKQVLLLNTPRDYFVPNPAGNGVLDKLTHCGNYGVDCSVKALSNLYDVPVDYYAQINFKGFETLIDAVGGVTVYSDQGFDTENGYIQKGENHLDGNLALGFARERYHVNGGDNGRGKNQMKVIKALIEKLTSGTTIISNYTEILKSLEGMFKTSMTMDEISLLVKMQLSDMAQWNVNSFAVTGSGGYEVTYSWPGESLYVMHPHENMVKHASMLIDRVIAGDMLTEADMTLPPE